MKLWIRRCFIWLSGISPWLKLSNRSSITPLLAISFVKLIKVTSFREDLFHLTKLFWHFTKFFFRLFRSFFKYLNLRPTFSSSTFSSYCKDSNRHFFSKLNIAWCRISSNKYWVSNKYHPLRSFVLFDNQIKIIAAP